MATSWLGAAPTATLDPLWPFGAARSVVIVAAMLATPIRDRCITVRSLMNSMILRCFLPLQKTNFLKETSAFAFWHLQNWSTTLHAPCARVVPTHPTPWGWVSFQSTFFVASFGVCLCILMCSKKSPKVFDALHLASGGVILRPFFPSSLLFSYSVLFWVNFQFVF